jgi:hypothetical protein
MRPINELRMAARWKLGRALSAVERGAGPGRGKKEGGPRPSFKTYISGLELKETSAKEAQRIGCMPDEEMAHAFDAREPFRSQSCACESASSKRHRRGPLSARRNTA